MGHSKTLTVKVKKSCLQKRTLRLSEIFTFFPFNRSCIFAMTAQITNTFFTFSNTSLNKKQVDQFLQKHIKIMC